MAKTAAAHLEEFRLHTVSTDCAALDGLLDGGLESDAITLVFGEGGSGKTNLALQCARVAIAAGHRVAYVDTEGVSEKRLSQVFDALPDETREQSIDRLLFYTPYTIAEQETMVKKTELLKDVGLIVVDSVNMHYRLHIDAPGGEKEARQSLLAQLHHLTMHARRHHIPVLITGQVYGGEDATQPFARRTMEHMVKALVRFEKRPDGTRRATVLKHRSIEEGRQARFVIGSYGLEDLDAAGRVPSAARRPTPAPQQAASSAAAGAVQSPVPDSQIPQSTSVVEEEPASVQGQGVGALAPNGGVPEEISELYLEHDADAASRHQDDGQVTAEPIEPVVSPDSEPRDLGDGHDSETVQAAVEEAPDGPAVNLLTDAERQEAEALPGFAQAHQIPRKQHSDAADPAESGSEPASPS